MSAYGSVTPADARDATARHYGLPVEVFAAFLDRRLKYSSGLYETPETSLDDAQTAKLAFVADRLDVHAGDRVLDVGCGWGSLVLFLAGELGCTVTGVTPSPTQAAYVTDRAADTGLDEHVRVRLGSISDLDLDERYDAAALLGSIVHMPDRAAVARKVHRALRSGGRLYLSESCFRNEAIYREFATRPGTQHVVHEIFGFADMVPLSALVRTVEDAGFSLTGLTDLTAHYRRTTTDWRLRAAANADAIDAVMPGLAAEIVRYLDTATAGWGYTTKHYALTAAKTRL